VEKSLKWWKRESRVMIAMVAALSLLLPLLAALQYRWLDQLSEAEREQMRGILNAAASRFSQDFDRELNAAYASFRPDRIPTPADGERSYSAKYTRWASVTQFPRLIKDVWMASVAADNSIVLKRLNFDARRFNSAPWPGDMDALHRRLENEVNRMRHLMRSPGSDLGGPDRAIPPQQWGPIVKDPLAMMIPVFGTPSARIGSNNRQLLTGQSVIPREKSN
jgi:hypothetical protein